MTTPLDARVPRYDLTRLAEVKLRPLLESRFLQASANCGGPPALRHRLLAEARDLFALEEITDRVRLHMLDLAAGLRALIELRAPVPCLPNPNQPLVVESRALLGLTYRPEVVFQPQPGFSFVHFLMPRPIWLPNCSFDASQTLCLGPVLPAGIAVKELLLLVYGALCMTTVTLDPADAAGTLNPAAADWWMRNASRIPLSREPFLTKAAPQL